MRLATESPGRRGARGGPRDEVEREAPRLARDRNGRERDAGDGTNVNGVERAVSIVAGGALAAWALKRKDLTGMVIGLVGGALVERGVSGHCRVYGALGLTSADEVGHLPHRASDRPVQQHGRAAVLDASEARKVERAVTVYGRSREELYAFWRDFGNLPRIMEHLEGVQIIDDRRSRWVVRGPAGKLVSWEAVIHNEIPGELIAWKSAEDADVPNAGSVHFTDAPGGRGTEVRVVLEYDPPAGKLGVAVAKLFGEEPGIQVREDLRRFKQLVETGELPVSEIPGQGAAAREREFNARASNDERLRASSPRLAPPHDPRHVPTPADEMRGVNTTELTGDAWR